MYRKMFLRLSMLVNRDRGGNSDKERGTKCIKIISHAFEPEKHEATMMDFIRDDQSTTKPSGRHVMTKKIYFSEEMTEEEKDFLSYQRHEKEKQQEEEHGNSSKNDADMEENPIPHPSKSSPPPLEDRNPSRTTPRQ